MAHLVLMTRGIQHQIDIWSKFMQTQMFWWKRQPLLKDKDGKFIKTGEVDKEGNPIYERGKEEVTKVQGALRPIQLWEYVIPEECMGEALAMLGKHKEEQLKLRPEVNSPAWALRKLLKLQKVPVIPEIQDKEVYQITDKYIPMNAVAVYPLGVKKDKKHDFIFGKEGYYQEGL